MKTQTTITPEELKIMATALPVVEAVPASQDSCWPGDAPAHDDDCTLTDHAASLAAVAATVGLSWEFSTWSAAAEWFLAAIEEVEAVATATERWDADAIREYVESHDENCKTPDDQLLAMFRAMFGRSPSGRDERVDMWSHICAGI